MQYFMTIPSQYIYFNAFIAQALMPWDVIAILPSLCRYSSPQCVCFCHFLSTDSCGCQMGVCRGLIYSASWCDLCSNSIHSPLVESLLQNSLHRNCSVYNGSHGNTSTWCDWKPFGQFLLQIFLQISVCFHCGCFLSLSSSSSRLVVRLRRWSNLLDSIKKKNYINCLLNNPSPCAHLSWLDFPKKGC